MTPPQHLLKEDSLPGQAVTGSSAQSARRTGGMARRVRVWWRASDLDQQLAEGTQPCRSPELLIRASQLVSSRSRLRFAGALESVVAESSRGCREGRGCRRGRSGVPLRRTAVAASRDELLDLAAALRSSARCRPQAAGLVSFLLRDARSPLYDGDARASPADLARAARTGIGA